MSKSTFVKRPIPDEERSEVLLTVIVFADSELQQSRWKSSPESSEPAVLGEKLVFSSDVSFTARGLILTKI